MRRNSSNSNMNYGLILAGGVGQRMRSSGMPKQFLEVFGKPIIIYTVEKFVSCEHIDRIVIACTPGWMEHLSDLLKRYPAGKPVLVTAGGKDRQQSVENGLRFIEQQGGAPDDIVVIHDAVRPMVEPTVITENIRVAGQKGCCMTVRPVVESVVITDSDHARFEDIKKRDDTYSLTSPQTFRLSLLREIYGNNMQPVSPFPLLDAALSYTFRGNEIPLVKEFGHNIKVTTPEDFYILRSLLEVQENRAVFGL